VIIGRIWRRVYCTPGTVDSSVLLVNCLRILMVLLALAPLACPADLAQRYFEAGRRAQRAGDFFGAYTLFSKASKLKPGKSEYAASVTSLQAALQVKAATAQEVPQPPAPARSLNAADRIAIGEITPSEAKEARDATLPPHLNPSPEKKSFDVRSEPRSAIEKV